MVKQSRETIEDQASEISNLRNQVELMNDQCNKIEEDFKKHKELIDCEMEKNRAVKKKNKKVKKTMGNEVAAMKEECEN